MAIKSILATLPEKTLAAITKRVATKRGRIFLDEDTKAFLYGKANGKTFLYIVDSDGDFMRLDGRLAGRGKPALSTKELYRSNPSLLKAIDASAYERMEAHRH